MGMTAKHSFLKPFFPACDATSSQDEEEKQRCTASSNLLEEPFICFRECPDSPGATNLRHPELNTGDKAEAAMGMTAGPSFLKPFFPACDATSSQDEEEKQRCAASSNLLEEPFIGFREFPGSPGATNLHHPELNTGDKAEAAMGMIAGPSFLKPFIPACDATTSENEEEKQRCAACSNLLEEPFICCRECPDLRLCTSCFARGTNVGDHLSSHCYSVFSDRIPILEDDWEIRDERKLLDLILQCGYGNWVDIGRRLNRSPVECKRHYDAVYLQSPPEHAAELRDCGLPPPPFIPAPLPPYHLKVGCDNPPRLHSSAPGYNALRSEFDSDHDHNEAEKDLALVDVDLWDDPEDSEFYQALQVGMVEVYTNRQQERARRRKVIRDHGLIMPHRTYTSMTRYITTLGRSTVEGLAPFAKLLTGTQFDYLLEGLHLAHELCEKQRRLSELRSLGVKSHYGATLMQRLSQMRTKHQREMKNNPLPLPGEARMEAGARGGSARKPAPPLEVSGLPMCELLSPQEKELCATVRLVPENFIEFKNLLYGECKKANGLRLAQARKCIKIDVNKTRKLFDFLMEQGVIFPPDS